MMGYRRLRGAQTHSGGNQANHRWLTIKCKIVTNVTISKWAGEREGVNLQVGLNSRKANDGQEEKSG